LLAFSFYDVCLHYLVYFVLYEWLEVETFWQIFNSLAVVKDVIANGAWGSHKALELVKTGFRWDLAPGSKDLSDLNLIAPNLNRLQSLESLFLLSKFANE